MGRFAGLDVGGKRTAVCVVDSGGKIVWQGVADTHPEMIAAALKRWQGKLDKVGLESAPFTPVHVKSIDSHRNKTLLGARDQLVKVKL